MLLEEILNATQFKISGGSEYLWNCYGSNPRILDFSNYSDESSSVSCIFNSETQQVFEVTVYSEDGRWYRWIDPDYIEKYKEECINRGVPIEMGSDTHKWIDLGFTEDVLRKASQVIESGSCDDDAIFEINLDDEQLSILESIAKERNITLNSLMDELVQEALHRAEKVVEEHKSKS